MSAVIVLWCVWMLHQHIPLNGVSTIHYVIDTPHGLIGFWPNQNERQSSRYFDIRTSVKFQQAEFVVVADHDLGEGWEVGVRVPPSIWHYRSTPLKFERSSDSEWRAAASLQLGDATRVAGKYTFVLRNTLSDGAPQLDSMDIVLRRESFFATMQRWLTK